MNIIFAALTMAFGMSAVILGILGLVGAGDGLLSSLVSLLLGGAAFIIGIRWIMASAGILGEVGDLRREARALNGGGTDEDVRRLMVRMLGIYRDRKTTVERMLLVAKIGGAVFLLIGGYNLAIALGGAENPFVLYGGVIAAAMNFGIGIAALFLSVLFGKYRAAWGVRLRESEKA